MNVPDKYKQRTIVPTNQLEENFLQNNPFYGQTDWKTLDDLRIRSALKDLREFEIMELQWPKKKVITSRMVHRPCEKTGNLVEDTVDRVEYIPMTFLECAAHLEVRVEELKRQAEAAGEVAPKPLPKTKKSSKKHPHQV